MKLSKHVVLFVFGAALGLAFIHFHRSRVIDEARSGYSSDPYAYHTEKMIMDPEFIDLQHTELTH